jgi:dihydroflavonol-4-reductase
MIKNLIFKSKELTIKTILVTGASGHIGGAVVRELAKLDLKIRAFVHKQPGDLINHKVEIFYGDVLDRESLKKAMAGVDGVINLAAIISIMGDPDGMVEKTNVLGVKNTAEVALESGVKRFVHVSSIHAFETHLKGHVIDENTNRVDSSSPIYDQSKNKGEIELRKVMARGLEAIIIHPTGVIGPYDFLLSRMGNVFLDLINKKMPALIEGGFDFVDSRDVAQVSVMALTKGKVGENYIVSGRYFTVRDLAEIAGVISGVKPPRMTTPLWLAKLLAPFAEMVVKITKTEPLFTRESLHALAASKVISHAKANRDFGYFPRDIRESISDIYESFYATGVLKRETKTGKPAQELV